MIRVLCETGIVSREQMRRHMACYSRLLYQNQLKTLNSIVKNVKCFFNILEPNQISQCNAMRS